MAGRGTDILLGGNAEFLTRERLRKENKDPEVIFTEHREEWDAVYTRFRPRS